MEELRKFIEESFEVIKRRAYLNQCSPELFTGLSQMLDVLEIIAKENLQENDLLLKDIADLKKIICKDQ